MQKNIILILIGSLVLLGTHQSAAQTKKQPHNVIFMIGDGMGIAQVYAAMVANKNKLELERCTSTGFSKTYSADNFTTDSGAGGTALACGVKTRNGMIGMNADSVAVESILSQAKHNKLSTGIVVACAVTHATPASYIAHQIDRDMYEEIADDYLKSNVDVFIGGGRKNFEERTDGRNLIDSLKAQNYNVVYNLNDLKNVKTGKLAGLLYESHNPKMPERGNMLPESTMAAIDLLDNNKKGFFLMVEGSQIDWAGHDNDSEQIIREVLDFDKTIGLVLNYAAQNTNTLVIITADHETGGLTLLNGKFGSDNLKAAFTTKNHSGVMVPVFAFGPGSEHFSGIMENTSFKNKIARLLKLK